MVVQFDCEYHSIKVKLFMMDEPTVHQMEGMYLKKAGLLYEKYDIFRNNYLSWVWSPFLFSNATVNCFYFYFKLQRSPNRNWAVFFLFSLESSLVKEVWSLHESSPPKIYEKKSLSRSVGLKENRNSLSSISCYPSIQVFDPKL